MRGCASIHAEWELEQDDDVGQAEAVVLMRVGLAAAVVLTALGCAPQGVAQRTEFPKPDRPVAPIVSPRWSADADRDRVNESGQIARALDVKAGMSVADIGAGSGY